jgi:hypothetical protein
VTQPTEKKAKGGKRPGAGRKKIKAECLVEGNKDFAMRVLVRIGKPGWRDYSDITKVKSDEDLALHFIAAGYHSYDQFNKLLDRKYGKPVQQIRVGNPEGEKFNVNVESARDKLIAALAG